VSCHFAGFVSGAPLTRKFLAAVLISELETAFVVSIWQLGKEVSVCMAIYTIIRIYEMPAESLQQATYRMGEALHLHVDRDFHVKDIVREPGAKPGQGKQIDLRPTAGWVGLALEQLGLKRKK
jgi:hypothetical protein